MLTKVKFRGPILFVHKDGALVDARIPDASVDGAHQDKTTAKKHLAVLMLKKANGADNEYVPLSPGTVVSIVGKNGSGNPKTEASFKTKVSLSKMVNAKADTGWELTLNNSAKDYVRVTFAGGSVLATNYTQDAFPIPQHWSTEEAEAPLPLLTVWSCNDGFEIAVGGNKIPLTDVEDVYIFNWENDQPSDGELENEMDRVHGRKLEAELDFRWLFKLLDPPAAGWDAWIKKGVGRCKGELPAPWSSLELQDGEIEPTYPPNSACDGGSWCI